MDNLDSHARRVLMLAPSFFGYRPRIAQEIQAQGYEVDAYDERPGNGFWDKTLLRLNCSLYHPVVKKYYTRIVSENQGKNYDYIFVIKGESVTLDALSILKQSFPSAKFVLYLWDSVENNPDCQRRMQEYDRVLTFDAEDAKNYGILYRPLFFQPSDVVYEDLAHYQYDAAFIGTAHSIRPRVVDIIGRQCLRRNSAIFSYFYMPHPAVYWLRKLTNPAFRYLKPKQVNYTPLSSKEIAAIYAQSRCILDVEHTKQRGMTIRTIEVLGMGKKLITTNEQVEKADFYNPNNICVIDRENPNVSEDFWSSKYQPVPQEILARYTLQAFVKEIFDF